MIDHRRKLNRLIDNLGFVLMFAKIEDAELVKIVLWTKDQIEATKSEE